MKRFRPVTIRMDDESFAALERIVEAEKRAHPRHTVSNSSVIRGLVIEHADRATSGPSTARESGA